MAPLPYTPSTSSAAAKPTTAQPGTQQSPMGASTPSQPTTKPKTPVKYTQRKNSGQNRNHRKMARRNEEIDMETPTIRYLRVTLGSDIGGCPRCHQPGKVGEFCYRCCLASGASIGTCDECNICGVIGEQCVGCQYELYEDIPPTGVIAVAVVSNMNGA